MFDAIETNEVFEMTTRTGNFVCAFMSDGQYVLRFYRGLLQQPGRREAYADRAAFEERMQQLAPAQEWHSIGRPWGSELNGLV